MILNLNSLVGKVEEVGNPLKSMEEICAKVWPVPLGTIELVDQGIGGTGRKTACKQHLTEVKVIPCSCLTAVENQQRHKKQGLIWSMSGTDFQNN